MRETMQTLTSILALVSASGAVLLVVARLLAPWVPLAGRVGARVIGWRTELTLVVAGGATLGSLYFSEVEHFVPCRWCWFQRAMMYPIAVIALVALIRRQRSARWYRVSAVSLAATGAVISACHYLIERKPELLSGSCAADGPPCAIPWFWEFGHVTLALMALCAFVAIIVFNTLSFDSVRSPQESS